jgi:hypothetical protein
MPTPGAQIYSLFVLDKPAFIPYQSGVNIELIPSPCTPSAPASANRPFSQNPEMLDERQNSALG